MDVAAILPIPFRDMWQQDMWGQCLTDPHEFNSMLVVPELSLVVS